MCCKGQIIPEKNELIGRHSTSEGKKPFVAAPNSLTRRLLSEKREAIIVKIWPNIFQKAIKVFHVQTACVVVHKRD